MLHANKRGWASHAVELEAVIASVPRKPSVVCTNESWLDASTEDVALGGHCLLIRRGRDEQQGGGILVFVLDDLVNAVTPS